MKPNVMFLMIDSFSANKFVGKTKTSITPNLNSLLSQGTYFEKAISVASTTVPSYSSMLTGLYPFQCVEKKDNVILFKTELKTFIKKFEEDGYHIFADLPEIIALSGLNKIFKTCNVFDTFSTLYDNIGLQIENKLSTLDEPWFYYVHLMDLHGSARMKNNSKIKNFSEKKFGKNNYEQMVSAMDYWIGKIASKINFDNTLLIITADHGSPTSEYDEIMEKENQESNEKRDRTSNISYKFAHKIVTHFPEFLNPIRKKLAKTYITQKNKSFTDNIQSRLNKLETTTLSPRNKRLLENAIMTTGNLFDEVCRIPLLFVGYSVPKRKIISQQVKNIDIFPTISEIINQNSNDISFGKSLLPLMNGQDFKEEPVFLQTITNSNEIKQKIGIRSSDYKYFRNEDEDSPTRYLFDLKKDPLEENNIAEKEPSIVNSMEQLISEIQLKGKPSNNESTVSKKEIGEAKKVLKKLGYI